MRIISMLLCFLMVITSIPTDAFAAEVINDATINETSTEQEADDFEEISETSENSKSEVVEDEFSEMSEYNMEVSIGEIMPIEERIDDENNQLRNAVNNISQTTNDITIKYTLVDQSGVFTKASDNTELCKAELTVADLNKDGSITYNDVFTAAHQKYYSAGVEGFAIDSNEWGPYITKFWGMETGSVGYCCNNASVSTGLETVVANDSDIVVYFYRDTTNWSDCYTYFGSANETAVVGTAKTFTTYGINSFGNAVVPADATVKVVDGTGSEVADLVTTVGADGTFAITFKTAGTYTIELGSGSGKYYVPSRCSVTVTDPEPVAKKHFLSKFAAAPSRSLTTIDLKDNVWSYDYVISSGKSSSYIRAQLTLSADAPEGSMITVGYKNSSGADATTTLTSGSAKSIMTPIEKSMTGSKLTFTVGVEGNTQTYVLNIVRTVDVKVNTVTDAKDNGLIVYNDQYLLPETSEKIKINADAFGSDLTINGAKATSGEAFEVTPVWDENELYQVTVKSTDGKESKEQVLTFKKLKSTTEFSGTYGENATWKLAEGVLTISGSGDMQDKVPWENLMSLIKKVHFDDEITSIGTNAFLKAVSITEVKLPSSLKKIGAYAFNYCSTLTQITLPEGLETICIGAFYGSGLKAISIPASVKTVEANAFRACKNMERAVITNAMGSGMFVDCISLNNVTFKESSLTTIPTDAFGNCSSLKNLVLPEGVTSFAKANGYGIKYYFESLTIPNTLTGFNGNTFGDYLTNVTVKENNPNYIKVGKVLYTKDKKGVVLAEKNLAGEVTIEDGAESIHDYAFANIAELTKVVLPSTVKAIGNYAFYYCKNLESVTLREGVESIGQYGFSYCNVLSDIKLPSTLKTLGESAFSACKAIKNIEIPAKVTELPNLLFSNATALETIILPAGLTSMQARTFFNCNALTTIYFRGDAVAWNTIVNRPADGLYDVVYCYGRTDIANITVQPEDRFFAVNSDATDGLSVTVRKPENVQISFAWYVNDTKSSVGGTLLTEGTKITEDGLTSYCTPDVSAIGTKYYYCVITSKLPKETLVNNTRIAAVEVANKLWEGEGTENNPFRLSSTEDMQKLATYVANGRSTEGKFFAVTEDVTLPAEWTPVGTATYRFAGTIDGKIDENNCATIIVPEGGKPLLGYVLNATVKNLNIKGTRIEGYGLIDNFVGINITSKTVLDNITILSGTNILKSGLLGTYITTNGFAGCSATYTAEISNCRVQSGVVIGYTGTENRVGSLAGRFIGVVENCESAATVKGVDYVGGLVGNMDNSMGSCQVKNSAFHGTVEGTGQFAGGIIGGGYEDSGSAPNANRPTLQGCSVDGTVKGNEAVGGITGGDRLVAQSYGGNAVIANHFRGTVSGTKYVGGIIGYYRSLNVWDTVSANTYSNAAKGIGYVAIIDTNVENPAADENMIIINTEKGTGSCPTVQWCTWKSNHNRTDDPLGADAEALCKKVSENTPIAPTCYEIKATGTYKNEYTVGEELDLTGIIVTAVWTDASTTTVDLSEIEITGYDKEKAGKQTITLSYDGVKTTITVTVKNPEGKISVTLSILGDKPHDSDTDGKVHTLTAGNLIEWVSAKSYTIDSNATAWDLIKSVLDENEMTYSNPTGGYIEWITKDGEKLDQKANGANSGWMFTINGVHGLLTVSEQYMKNGDVLILHYTDDYTQEKDDAAAVTPAEVIALIDLIPETITLESEKAIEAARAAYIKLAEADKNKVTNYQKLLDAEKALAELKKVNTDVKKVYEETKDYFKALVKKNTPTVNSIGGEWLVLGLARSGAEVPEGYFNNVASYVKKNIDSKGRLSSSKSTDNSRVILALTAAGYDPRNVGGYNLLEGLTDMDYIVKQGINGPIWALIALDSHNYVIPTSNAENPTTREKLIQEILKAQLSDGGWALSGTEADSDMTGMALQALAPYYNNSNPDIMTAVNKAITKLSSMQEDNGAYATVGTITSESIAQVVTALAALEINPHTDSRFKKNGFSAMDALVSFAVKGGGFEHIKGGGLNGMASEQGFYALVAYMRLIESKNSLYDMSDVTLKVGAVTGNGTDEDKKEDEKNNALLIASKKDKEAAKKVVDLINTITEVNLNSGSKLRVIRAAYDSLTLSQKKLVTNYDKLVSAENTYVRIKVAYVEKLIREIGTVTLDSKDKIQAARTAYNKLTVLMKNKVTNLSVLEAAEVAYEELLANGKKKTAGKLTGGTVTTATTASTYLTEESSAVNELLTQVSDTSMMSELLEVIKAYENLSAEDKALLDKEGVIEELKERVAELAHTDRETGISVSGVDWNVQIVIEDIPEVTEIQLMQEKLGSNTMLVVWNISLKNLLTGEEVEPEGSVLVKIPLELLGDFTAYDGLIVVHYTKDGTAEYLNCTVVGDCIVFNTADFSHYAVAGYYGTSPIEAATAAISGNVEDADNSSVSWIPWTIAGGCSAVLLAVLLMLANKNRKNVQAGE